MSLSTLHQRPGRLPAEMTSFVGRRDEMAAIERLLARCRLVTLTGPGGVGKTRLAIRAARAAAPPDGVWFVDLTAAPEPGLIARVVADALGLPDHGAGEPLDAAIDFLAHRPGLLVLDTCEHLIDSCAMLAETLLHAAPDLRVLATSRQPLDIAGEHTVVVAPLPSPAPGADGAPNGGAPSAGAPTAGAPGAGAPGAGRGGTAWPAEGAVELFADRASAVVPGWTAGGDDREAVALLCRRLDGIPLAIELAAVQVRALSPRQILERLDRHVLEVRGRRTALPRHQTLRAAIDWSHGLCSPDERLLWARLSVLAADFDLEAAERVCCDDRLAPAMVLDVVAGLLAKSIVQRVERDGRVRYRMLGTLREYGAERLEELGETERTRARAFEWLAGTLRTAAAELDGPRQRHWLEWHAREEAGARALLDRATGTASDEVLVAAHLCNGRLLCLRGRVGEAWHWVRRMLDTRPVGDAPYWGEALGLAAILAAFRRDLTTARDLAAQAATHPSTAYPSTAYLSDASPVGTQVDGVRPVAAESGGGAGYVRMAEGVIALQEGDPERARELLTEAELLLGEACPGEVIASIVPLLTGIAHAALGDLDAARDIAERTMRDTERAGNVWGHAYARALQGIALLLLGRADEGLAAGRAGLRTMAELDNRLGLALSLEVVACGLAATGQHRAAAGLFGAARRQHEDSGAVLFGPTYAAIIGVVIDGVRAELGPELYEAAAEAGGRTERDAVLADALAERRSAPSAGPGAAPGAGRPRGPLSPREWEIAELVAQGLTNREIADRLVIAKRTADSHVEHILAKLGASSRAEIAAWYAHNARPDPA
ncbi:LuxR family transcriptional regulator [Actinomadura logoneensis]|uniref:LuxR family transcriptional regulator n=1 Tax=Actinomadura logoneensis TaxID=2293572 RepID=A0A372JJL2_9ACTN|nr:LuxR C-terminal-related transcriptional regulator [Actinomadura logoneensis]RFU39488.1 LuxR family transcriptional regulator [Actinomadura logoneensis]